MNDARWLSRKPASAPAALALGTMNFGGRTDEAESLRICARALAAGIDCWDTANVYGSGASERVVGKALRGARDRVFLATKVGLEKREGLSPAAIAAAIDRSLRNLGTDHVDLYWQHAPDPSVPLADTLGAIEALVQAGKVRHYGLSNFASWQILEARSRLPPAEAQLIYNLLVRQLDLEYFAFAAAHGLHTTIYNPLAGGLLVDAHVTGPRFHKNAMYERRYAHPRMVERAAVYARVAAEHGMSLIELAYRFCASHPSVDSVLLGPGSMAHLEAAIAACAVPLTSAAQKAIDATHRDLEGTDARYAR